MFVRLAIVFALLYGSCFVDSIVIDLPENYPVHTSTSKQEYANKTTAAGISADSHIKAKNNQPFHDPISRDDNIEENRSEHFQTPMKFTIPRPHNERLLTRIVHPLPKTMHDMMPQESFHPTALDRKRAHEDFLRYEVPTLQRKLYQHYTAEELRQRRKELENKWQKMYDKFSHGLLDKNKNHLILAEDQLKTHYVLEKRAAESNSSTDIESKDGHRVKNNSKYLKDNFADMHIKVDPHTRRILEHQNKDTQSPEFQFSSFHDQTFESQYQEASTTLSTSSENTESIRISELPNSKHYVKHTTEGHFNPANYIVYGPYIPLMPAMYWPKGTTTQSTT